MTPNTGERGDSEPEDGVVLIARAVLDEARADSWRRRLFPGVYVPVLALDSEAGEVNPPRQLMRGARRSGGRIDKAETRFDGDRGGRVLTLTVFWPDQTGYEVATPNGRQP